MVLMDSINNYGKPRVNEDKILPTISILIDNQIDLDSQAAHGHTAMMYAVAYNYPDVVELLLDSGANPNVKAENGETALHIALRKRNFESSLALIKNENTRLDIKCNKGKAPKDYLVGLFDVLGDKSPCSKDEMLKLIQTITRSQKKEEL